MGEEIDPGALHTPVRDSYVPGKYCLMRFIKKREFESLISLPNTAIRNDLKIPEDNRDYYLLQDGRILAYTDSTPNRVQMFESIDELNKIIKIVRGDMGEGPILLKCNELINAIPGNIDACRFDLSRQINIDNDLLDFSPESLKLIDKKLRKLRTIQEYFDKVYGLLLIYFGEVVRRHTNGKWGINQHNGISEPYIISKSSHKIFYAKELHEQASEDFKDFSLYREFNVCC